MRKLKGILLGCFTGLLLLACSKDVDQPGPNPDGDMVRIQLDAPEAMQVTRSAPGTNSAKGGLTNVDWSKYDLRYQLAVYSSDGSKLLLPSQSKVYDTYSPAVFEFRLTPNNTYKFVAWADFVTQGTTEDLHYNTSDLSNISIKTDGSQDKQINDESRDAYFVTKNIEITQTFDESLTLKRPFAKIRIVTTDWDENNDGIAKPDNFKVIYHDCKRFSGLNAVTEEAIGETDATNATVYTGDLITDENGDKYYAEGYDANVTNRTIMVDYLIATSAQQAIHFSIDMLSGGSSVISRDFTTEIPIQRNYLTTLIGNLLSVGGSVTIDIDDNFDGDDNQIEIKDPKYITYTATSELDYNHNYYGERFGGPDCEFIDEQCTYNSETGEGKWAYTGTITKVKPSAFNGETELQSITLPEGIISIGDNAFNMSGLESIVLPESLIEIEQVAFSKTNLTEIVIPANVEVLGNSAFAYSDSGNSPLQKVVFEGNKIQTIDILTFTNCDNLQNIDLPEGLTSIKYNAFDGCTALTSITIPNSVTEIGEAAFVFCTGLTEAIIGDGVKTIGERAFAECKALKTVVIGKSIQYIGDQAFNTRTSYDKMTLEKITVLFDDIASGSFPVLDNGSRGVFPKGGWDPVNYKIYVPKGTKAEYQRNWSDYSSLIVEMQ